MHPSFTVDLGPGPRRVVLCNGYKAIKVLFFDESQKK